MTESKEGPDLEASANSDEARAVSILYTNYRGEKAWRRITPIRIWFGATEWHPEEQWLLDAIDLEKGTNRSFAMGDIEAWRAGRD